MTRQSQSRDDVRPELLVLSGLPAWDMDPLAEQFRILTLQDAADRTALFARCGAVRAVAAPGHHGADAA